MCCVVCVSAFLCVIIIKNSSIVVNHERLVVSFSRVYTYIQSCVYIYIWKLFIKCNYYACRLCV